MKQFLFEECLEFIIPVCDDGSINHLYVNPKLMKQKIGDDKPVMLSNSRLSKKNKYTARKEK